MRLGAGARDAPLVELWRYADGTGNATGLR
jgi:hypothetical protein